MADEARDRRLALDGLGKILDAGALEELFTGPAEEALFLYDLLQDATRGRQSTYYWEIVRTARLRGVSPEYVIDRAVVLHATLVERRRTDLYRILGVPPLSSNDTIRRRWLEVAKVHHPDVGGDVAVFRLAKQAYDVLSDATRRGDYERFWLRALGPFERVAPADRGEVVPPGARAESAPPDDRAFEAPAADEPSEPPVAPVASPPEFVREEPAAAPPHASRDAAGLDGLADALLGAARILDAGAALDRRLANEGGIDGLASFLARVRTALASVRHEEIDALRADALAAIERLERERRVLAALGAMRAKLPPVRLAS